MKRLAALLCLFCLAAPVSAAWDIAQLMHDLSQRPSGRAKFVEKKYIAMLDKPLISSGELSFTAPDRLEKRTLQPKPELIRLDGDMLYVEHGGKQFNLRLSSRPEAVAFVESIRGTLTGNQKALEANYALALSGTQASWTLRLQPTDTNIAALLTRIDIRGARDRVTSIEYQLADGDRTVMNITPLEGEQ
jgi:outer membrane lipoprotein-sorting protein